MLDRFRGKLYNKRALDLIETGLTSALGEERGHECLGMFAAAISKAQEYGEVPVDLTEQFRKGGLTVQEAALSCLDASITAVKRLLAQTGSSADIDAVVADMEAGIDHMFLANPGRILPRNGNAGPTMEQFTSDWKPR